MQVNAALLQEFQPSLPNSRLECDAVDDSARRFCSAIYRHSPTLPIRLCLGLAE